MHPDTELKLADYFQINNVSTSGIIVPEMPYETRIPTLGTSVVDDAIYCDFVHVVPFNPLPHLQSWHIDGYSFFVVW